MSCKNRGTISDPKDFYPTPRPTFLALLPRLPIGSFAPDYFDPCAGDGRLVTMLRESGRIAHGADLFPQAQDVYPMEAVDYLADTTQRDFLLTNPPFSVAFAMCQHARKYSDEFMFLLRLSFLESEERGDWLSANEPTGLHVLKKRPSFVMSITCKSKIAPVPGRAVEDYEALYCGHNWLLPIESERPKVCVKCGGSKISISTSDNSGYAWYYWGERPELCGIHHI